ncbi:MAG: hypothetical protein HQ582_28330 [Planctomycetes bacterium]|nr:hypothetical protein [Planctomycetota bacterium]
MIDPGNEDSLGRGQPDRIERQLSEEADRLLASLGPSAPTAALLAEHHRRARGRRLTRGVFSITAVLMIVVAAGLIRGLRPAQPTGGGRPAEENVARSETPLRPPPGSQSPPAVVSWEPDPTLPAAMPIFITLPEGDKQRVIATGIYVPEHTEPLDFLDLTPAEQHAVRQVLGIPEEKTLHEPI